MRKNTKIVIWTVIVAFVLWGGFSVGTSLQAPSGIAGELFGKKIYTQEFDLYLRSAQIFSYSGQSLEDPDLVRRQAWQSLMLSMEARNRGIDITDTEVRDEIYRLLQEHKIETTNPEFYRRWLQSTVRETPQDFEKQIRELLRVQKLVQIINEEPVAVASEEEVQERFLRENHQLGAEMAKFSSLESAEEFVAKVTSEKKWQKEKESELLKDKVREISMITMDAWVNLWQIPPDEFLGLLELEENDISQPIKLNETKYVVFLIKEKKLAQQDKYESEMKEKYRVKIENERKYQRFIEWAGAVQERAQLKDYLPTRRLNPTPTPGTEGVTT